MSDVTTLPVHGEVFLDARGDDRSLRVNWHQQAGPEGLLVLSLWREGTCVGTFRMRARDVPLMCDVLARGTEQGQTGAHTYASSAEPYSTGYAPSPFPAHRRSADPPNAAGAGSRSA